MRFEIHKNLALKLYNDFLKVKEVELVGNSNLSKKIYLGLPFEVFDNDKLLGKLIIDSNKNITETSKNSKGQVESYRLSIYFRMCI